MRLVTVYYDDEKGSCRQYIEAFSAYEGVICKKASEFQNQAIIFEDNDNVGFVFESTKEKIPASVRHVIERLVMNKQGRCFIAVIGGSREMIAIREANTELSRRGYKVKNVYSQYLFEKFHLNTTEAVKKIVDDVENEKNNLESYRERAQEHTTKQMRKFLRRELREYKKYKKKKDDG